MHALGIVSRVSKLARVAKRIFLARCAYPTKAVVVEVVQIHVRISAYKRSAMRHAPQFGFGKVDVEGIATDLARRFAGQDFK